MLSNRMDMYTQNADMFDLRRASAQDTALILTLPQTITEARWWAGPQTRWPLTSEDVQRWHADPDVHPYILSQGSTLLGYGELWVDPVEQEVELARLIVAPTHRGQGVGVCLVRLLLKEARHFDYPYAFLRVNPDNQVAIACYLRAGFERVSPSEQASFNQGQPIKYLWMRILNSSKGE